MIARLWHGVTPAEKADAYLRFLQRRAVPDYRAVAGNRSVTIYRRAEADVTHFMIVTQWDSIDAIRAFAGEEATRAKYYDEDREFLLDFEPHAQHFDVYG